MTEEQEDQKVRQLYNEYDERFRAAKKRGQYKAASEWKAKRDALSAQVDAAIKRAAQKEKQV